MELIISNSSGKPIYEQITAQIKQLVLSNGLSQGEALPSMRQLAKDLHISVITTKRAYEDLERDGFLVNVPGKGCFVAEKNPDFVREEHLRQAQEALQRAVDVARVANLPEEALHELISLLYKGE